MKARFRFLCEAALIAALVLPAARADSLWQAESNRSMYSDRKAFAVGDILTVLVQESSTASKDNNTKTAKKAAVDASLNSILYTPAGSAFLTKRGQLPALNFNADHSFDGGGTIENKEEIVNKITVRVVDVLPNKNLVVEGSRHTSFSGESQDVIVRGVVRPEDIQANNTVYSYNVADATIKIVNKGTVTDSQRKGWFTRLWDKITPF